MMKMMLDGSRVDYQQMAASELFTEYCQQVARLKFMQPETFSEDKVDIYHLISSLEMIFVTFNNCLEESVLHQHLQQSHNPRDGSPGQRGRGTHTQGGKM